MDLTGLREWTLEMNPATVSLEKARLLKSLGVNRISMGVQSWDPALLEVLLTLLLIGALGAGVKRRQRA